MVQYAEKKRSHGSREENTRAPTTSTVRTCNTVLYSTFHFVLLRVLPTKQKARKLLNRTGARTELVRFYFSPQATAIHFDTVAIVILEIVSPQYSM